MSRASLGWAVECAFATTLSPFQGSSTSGSEPKTCALGCIPSPLRGYLCWASSTLGERAWRCLNEAAAGIEYRGPSHRSIPQAGRSETQDDKK
jgi:hypothetical protein